MGKRFGLVPVVKTAVGTCLLVMLALLGHYAVGGDRMSVLIGLYFVASAGGVYDLQRQQ